MLLHALLGAAAADLGVGAGAEALGQRVAELDLVRRHVGFERLHVGVGGDELDAVELPLIIVLTALPPPPPTPMTWIFA